MSSAISRLAVPKFFSSPTVTKSLTIATVGMTVALIAAAVFNGQVFAAIGFALLGICATYFGKIALQASKNEALLAPSQTRCENLEKDIAISQSHYQKLLQESMSVQRKLATAQSRCETLDREKNISREELARNIESFKLTLKRSREESSREIAKLQETLKAMETQRETLNRELEISKTSCQELAQEIAPLRQRSEELTSLQLSYAELNKRYLEMAALLREVQKAHARAETMLRQAGGGSPNAKSSLHPNGSTNGRSLNGQNSLHDLNASMNSSSPDEKGTPPRSHPMNGSTNGGSSSARIPPRSANGSTRDSLPNGTGTPVLPRVPLRGGSFSARTTLSHPLDASTNGGSPSVQGPISYSKPTGFLSGVFSRKKN